MVHLCAVLLVVLEGVAITIASPIQLTIVEGALIWDCHGAGVVLAPFTSTGASEHVGITNPKSWQETSYPDQKPLLDVGFGSGTETNFLV